MSGRHLYVQHSPENHNLMKAPCSAAALLVVKILFPDLLLLIFLPLLCVLSLVDRTRSISFIFVSEILLK